MATFRWLVSVPFGLFVIALRSVGDEGQIGGAHRVSVCSAGKRGELTLDSEAITLEACALVVAGKTKALQFLRLAPEGCPHGNDVVKLLDFRLLA